jgi:hypothetical protein
MELFDPAAFGASGIKLTIQEPFEFQYECRGYQFAPNLSVIDALMWNSSETIRECLEKRKSLTNADA